jgi:hypothetical protein
MHGVIEKLQGPIYLHAKLKSWSGVSGWFLDKLDYRPMCPTLASQYNGLDSMDGMDGNLSRRMGGTEPRHGVAPSPICCTRFTLCRCNIFPVTQFVRLPSYIATRSNSS